ncbi:multidrug efflux system membrane fusion protein [Roseiarcus fermentans]|uniref:Multidrug efflux system membrane fusion protein n=1 Tax=Roseiarcus fermentans TaxID=1473586 RepID=A0A366F5J7_9HYPH|nr:efflux RND transporter periplasmic adaptor subunit [Roseiarcus fermentans]RBP09913.1 multidrug efflux system membrane fusion protein [Roseiarcus fermentans]
MRFRPGLTLLVVVAAVGVLGAADYSRRRSEAAAPRPESVQPTVPVTAASVASQDVPIVFRALGTVQSIQAVNVQSRVNGQIMQAFFKQGQAVKAGDPLFLIDPRPYQAALDQAQAQLQHDQALLAEAQTDLARYQRLVTENSIALQQAADQAFVVQQDEGTVKLDQANVETAKLNVEYAHINSPVAGIAGAMAVDPGNYVQAGAGTTLVTITQIAPIYVTFPLPQSELDEVRAAQSEAPLDVRALSQEGRTLGEGKLTFINNQVVATTGTVALYATFPNDNEALWPGAFVTIDLMLGVRKNALTAPVAAVASGPNGDYVYAISSDDVVRRVPVQVVARQNGLAVFTKGVSPGEQVVVNGQYNLDDGVKVAVEAPKATASAAP